MAGLERRGNSYEVTSGEVKDKVQAYVPDTKDSEATEKDVAGILSGLGLEASLDRLGDSADHGTLLLSRRISRLKATFATLSLENDQEAFISIAIALAEAGKQYVALQNYAIERAQTRSALRQGISQK